MRVETERLVIREFREKDYFEYGFNKLHLESIVAETVLNNKKSISTITSLGMKISETHEEDLPVWIITKNYYQNKKEYT